MVEFALVVFILALLVFGCLEIGMRVRDSIIANNMGRITGELLYRECSFREQLEIPSCMDAVRGSMQSYAAALGKDASIIVTHLRDATLPLNITGPYSAPSVFYSSGGGSKFSPGNFSGASPYGTMFATNGLVWIAEVVIRPRLISSFINIPNQEIHAASIL